MPATDAVVNENIDVRLIRKYFTYDVSLLVEQILKCKQKMMTWICNVCHHDLHAKTSGPSIACESSLPFCLYWPIEAAKDQELILPFYAASKSN